MPAVSVEQSRFLNMKFGHAWVKAHHFDNSTKGLPEHVKKRKRLAANTKQRGGY